MSRTVAGNSRVSFLQACVKTQKQDLFLPDMRLMEVLPMSRRRETSDLQIPWRKSFPTYTAVIAAVAGLSRRVPLCQAWCSPARTRSRRMLCSKAANTKSMPAIAPPVDVVRSSALLSEEADVEIREFLEVW